MDAETNSDGEYDYSEAVAREAEPEEEPEEEPEAALSNVSEDDYEDEE